MVRTGSITTAKTVMSIKAAVKRQLQLHTYTGCMYKDKTRKVQNVDYVCMYVCM